MRSRSPRAGPGHGEVNGRAGQMPELRAQEPGTGRSVGTPAVRQLPQAAAVDRRRGRGHLRRDRRGRVRSRCGRPVGAVVRALPDGGPCRMVSPALEKVATEMAGKIKLVKVNVDEAPRLQQRFGVQAIPTLLLLRKGEVIARQVGAVPEQAIKAWVNGALQPG